MASACSFVSCKYTVHCMVYVLFAIDLFINNIVNRVIQANRHSHVYISIMVTKVTIVTVIADVTIRVCRCSCRMFVTFVLFLSKSGIIDSF